MQQISVEKPYEIIYLLECRFLPNVLFSIEWEAITTYQLNYYEDYLQGGFYESEKTSQQAP